ncbi:MAG: hypothetical protein ACPG1Z_02880 [Planctomycetota bacterium]
MKGKEILTTGISRALTFLRSLRNSPSAADSDQPSFFPKKSSFSEDTWLQIAALFSIFLHLGLLILLPAPGNRGALPAQSGPMSIQFLAREPEPEPAPPAKEEISTTEEELDQETIEEQSPIEEDPPADLSPESNPPIPPTIPSPESTIPDLPLDAPAEPESPVEDGEIERIQSLLSETLQLSKSDKARDRWLMLEVREPIRRGLSELHGRGVSVSDAEGQGKFLLSFWIDGEGWIYDLSLKPAPGVEIDAFGIRDMIAGLNPLKAAPAGVKTPIKLQLRVQNIE